MDRSTILLTILLGVASGIGANLGTPIIKSLLLKGVFSRRKIRIQVIKNDIALVDHYLHDSKAFFLYLFKELFRIIFWFLFGMALLLLSHLNPQSWFFRIAMMLIGFALGTASSSVSFTKSVWQNPEEHRARLLIKLAEEESKL